MLIVEFYILENVKKKTKKKKHQENKMVSNPITWNFLSLKFSYINSGFLHSHKHI